MRTTDRPGSPDDGMQRSGPPELERVGRRNGFRPAIAAVAVVAALLAVAVWKPWEPGRGPVATYATIPPDAAGGLLPAITGRPDGSSAPAPAPTPSALTYAGLDLSEMGTRDPHDGWGVAVAYVSQTQLDNARFGGAPDVTPVVSWELIGTGHALPGPVLDHAAVTSVAVAVTWPTDITPVAVHLVMLGPLRPDESGRSWPRPRIGTEILLTASLDELMTGATDVPQIGAVRSGAYFLSSRTAGDPTTWAGRGWPPGDYTFLVDLGGGAQVTLPFVIAAAEGA